MEDYYRWVIPVNVVLETYLKQLGPKIGFHRFKTGCDSLIIKD